MFKLTAFTLIRANITKYSVISIALNIAACETMTTTPAVPQTTAPATPSSIIKHANNTSSRTLWVFIEGDGTPWVLGRWPARRPIVKKPVAYQLWQNTQTIALYLRRPCYFDNTGFNVSSFASTLASTTTLPGSCTANWWTTDIYSQGVIRALRTELEAVLQQHTISRYILIGHSGGGTLAMLLAANMPQKPQLIITLAGNLRPAKFNQAHKLPKSTLKLPLINTPQWHYSGAQDSVIANSTQKICHKQPNAHCYSLANTQHSDGWLAHWPAIEQKVQYFISAVFYGAIK